MLSLHKFNMFMINNKYKKVMYAVTTLYSLLALSLIRISAILPLLFITIAYIIGTTLFFSSSITPATQSQLHKLKLFSPIPIIVGIIILMNRGIPLIAAMLIFPTLLISIALLFMKKKRTFAIKTFTTSMLTFIATCSLYLLISGYLWPIFLYEVGVFLVNSFPFFLILNIAETVITIIYFSSALKISSSQDIKKFTKYNKNTSICISLALGIGLTYFTINNAAFESIDTDLSMYDPAKYAKCAWLNHVPKDWLCRDEWNGSQRHLISYNPKDLDQYVELQISERIYPFKHICTSVFPVNFAISPSPSGQTSPYLCLSTKDIFYIASWEQDSVDFRLIGHKVSLKSFMSQLHKPGYPGNNESSEVANRTLNTQYAIAPEEITIDKNNTNYIHLLHTNLCVKEKGSDSFRLHEQIGVRIKNTPILKEDITILDGEECILNVPIPQDISPGTYDVFTEINWLEQKLTQQLTVL